MKTSYSEVSQHRRCPQNWYYGRVLKLERERVDTAAPLHFGSWWHALRAVYSIARGTLAGSLFYAPETLDTPAGPLPVDGLTVGDIIDASKMYWRGLSGEVQEEWLSVIGEDLPDRLVTLNARWIEQWEEDMSYELPLAVELGWSRLLGDTEHSLVGYIDEVYLDRKRGIVVVRDHKTSKALGTQSSLDDMMDSQLQFYAWGAAPRIAEWGEGAPTAVAYDRVRTAKPTRPRLTKSGALSKQTTQYDLATYLAWVAEGQQYAGLAKDGSGAGTYEVEQSVVDHLSSPSWRSLWFQRTLVPLNSNVVTSHLVAAADAIEDMKRTEERVVERKFAQRNLGASCKWCDFAALCRAQMMGGADGDYQWADYGLQEKKR